MNEWQDRAEKKKSQSHRTDLVSSALLVQLRQPAGIRKSQSHRTDLVSFRLSHL